MNTMKITAGVVAALVLAACDIAPERRLSTPSGDPEVSIPGVQVKAAWPVLMQRMTAASYSMVTMSDYAAVFKSADLGAVTVTLGYQNMQITFTPAETASGLHIGATSALLDKFGKVVVPNGGTGNWRQEIQGILDSVRNTLAPAQR
jgi:hypothetical protein